MLLVLGQGAGCSESAKDSGDFGDGTGSDGGTGSGATGDGGGGTGGDDGDTAEPLPGCANGVVENDEECDDGNQINGDGCNKDCTVGTDTTVWEQTYDGEAGGDDIGNGVAVDSAGNVIVIGSETVTDQGRNVWIRKYDADGEELWSDTYDGPDSEDDVGRAVAAGDGDAVLVCGHTTDAGGTTSMWVRRYDADGAEEWTQTFPGNCNGIAGDGGTGAVVVGRAPEAAGERDDAWVASLDAGGAIVWEQAFGAADRIDQAKAVTVDGDGNVVAAGTLSVEGEAGNLWVAKLGSDGMELWSDGINGPDGADDSGQGVAVGGGGDVVVAGYVTEDGTRSTYVAVYDPDGSMTTSWTSAHPTVEDFEVRAEDVTVTAGGDVVVAGYIEAAVTNEETNWWVRRYDADGATIWTQLSDLTGEDEANAIATAGGDHIVIAGAYKELARGKNVFVRKLALE